MNRRTFLFGSLAVGAAATLSHRVIFDMGSRLWVPRPWIWQGIYPVYYGHGGLANAYLVMEHRQSLDPNMVDFRKTILDPSDPRHRALLRKWVPAMEWDEKIPITGGEMVGDWTSATRTGEFAPL